MRDGLKTGLLGGGIFALSALVFQGTGYVIGYTIDEEYGARLGADIGAIIFFIAFIVILFGYKIYLHYDTNKSVKRYDYSNSIDVQKQRFIESGFGNINNKHLNDLITSPVSPLNVGNNKVVDLSACYKWMCEKASWDLDKIEHEKVFEMIGVSYSEIPLDESLPRDRALLKRIALAKNYILKKEGLRYRSVTGRFSLDDEYSNRAYQYIEEHRNNQEDTQ